MKEKGRINSIENNIYKITVDRHSACTHCDSQGSCMESDKKSMEVSVPVGSYTYKVGDKVDLELTSSKLVWASFLTYIMPLFMLLIGAVLPDYIFGESTTDTSRSIGAFIGLAVGFVILYYVNKILEKNKVLDIELI